MEKVDDQDDRISADDEADIYSYSNPDTESMKDDLINVAVKEVVVAEDEETGQELDIGYDWNIRIDEEDKDFGKELYSVLLLCPSHLMEAVRLSVFFKDLIQADRFPLPGYEYDLKTLVAATFQQKRWKAPLPRPPQISFPPVLSIFQQR